MKFLKKREAQNHVISVTLKGGLGNQLFQFAKATSISLETNTSLIFSTSWYKGQNLRMPELGHFRVPLDVPVKARIINGNLFFEGTVNCTCLTKKNIREIHYYYYELILPLECISLDGYWQSRENFAKYDVEIKKFLRKSLPAKVNDITVHSRLGDYFKDMKVQETHPVMGTEYYVKALKLINFDKEDKIVGLISDDPSIALEEILPKEYRFKNLASDNLIDDFAVLVSSRRLVIANSTFSWWAAFLSEAEVVISPAQWFSKASSRNMNTCDLYLENWIRV